MIYERGCVAMYALYTCMRDTWPTLAGGFPQVAEIPCRADRAGYRAISLLPQQAVFIFFRILNGQS